MSLHMILVGASGSGKTSVLKELRKCIDFRSTVSCTTRVLRTGEVQGRDYYSISPEDFRNRIKQDLFAEWSQYPAGVGNLYGTLAADLQGLLDAGHRVIYDVDVQGARQIKRKFPDVIVNFVIPPSMEELRRRILADPMRNHSEADLEQRLAAARMEIKTAYELADHVVLNEKLDHTVEHLLGFVGYCETLIASGKPLDESSRSRFLLDCFFATS